MQYMLVYSWDTVYAAQAGLEVDILLAVLSQYWDFRHVSTHLVNICLFVCLFL